MSYKSVRKELAEQSSTETRCRRCVGTAAWETLSSYAGLCGGCYAAYCRQLPSVPERYVANDHELSWAEQLKARHANGDRLTPSQVSAYRAALKLRPPQTA